jgi:hypothetical protein
MYFQYTVEFSDGEQVACPVYKSKTETRDWWLWGVQKQGACILTNHFQAMAPREKHTGLVC